jgi:hypothetical protein
MPGRTIKDVIATTHRESFMRSASEAGIVNLDFGEEE